MARLTEKERAELRQRVKAGPSKQVATASTAKTGKTDVNTILKALGGTTSTKPGQYQIPDRSNLAPGASPYGMNQTAFGALQQFTSPTVDNFQAAQINATRPKLFEAVPQFQKEHPLYEPKGLQKITDVAKSTGAKVFEALGIKPAGNEKEFPSYFERQQQKEVNTGKLENLIGGLASGATFGLTKKVEEALYGPLAKGGYETKSGRTGEIVGSFMQPGAKAIGKGISKLPVNNRIVKGVLEGAALGGAGQVGQEAVDVGFGGRDSLAERAKRVGEATALGGGLGIGGEIVSKGVSKLGGFAKRIAEQTTMNSPQFRQVVNMLGEDGAKAQVGKQNLADLDEQLMNASKGNAPDKQAQVKNLLNERSEVVNYIKQFEPEFNAPLPRLRGERQAVSIPQETLRQPQNAPQTGAVRPPIQATRTPKKPGQRGFHQTMEQSANIGDEITSALKASPNRAYTRVKNKGQVERAKQAIAADADKVESELLSKKDYDSDDVAKSIQIVQELQRSGNIERAVNIAERVSEELTRAGQKVQAARILNKLSPEGQLMLLTRKAKKSGMKLDPEDAKRATEAAEEKLAAGGAEVRSSEYEETLKKLASGAEPTADDIRIINESIERGRKYLPEETPQPKQPRQKKPLSPRMQKAVDALDKAEQEAMARINKRRNIGFLPQGVNPFRDVTDPITVVTSRIAKGAINGSNYVGEIVRTFGEEFRPHAKRIFEGAKRRIMNNPDLKELRKQITTAEDVVEMFKNRVHPRPEDLEKIKDLASSLTKMEGKTAEKAEIELQKIFQKYNKHNVGDKVQAFRYLMMLGQESTQLINTLPGPTYQALLNYFGNAAATGLDVLMNKAFKTRRTRSVYGANPLKFYRDYAKNLSRGVKFNWHGLNPEGLDTADEVMGLALNGPILKYGTAGILPTYERSVKALQGGADYALYKTVYDREMLRQGYLDAKRKGLTDRGEIEAHIKKFIDEPDSDAIDVADRQARRDTYQSNKSLGGYTANMVNKAHPLPKFFIKGVIPFLKTPFNIGSHAFSLTPGGFIKGGIKLLAAKTPGQRSDALRELGLALPGAGLTWLGYKLGELGVITDANQSGDSDVDKLKEQTKGGAFRFNQSAFKRVYDGIINGASLGELKEAGKFQDGDDTWDYNKLQPFALPVTTGAAFQKSREEGKGVGQSLLDASGSGLGSLFSMSALKSIQDITGTGYGQTDEEKAQGIGQRVVESYAKSFSPSILAREARRTDVQRQPSTGKGFASIPQNLKEYYQSRTPSYLSALGLPTSKELPARLTTLGDVKENPKGYLGSINPLRPASVGKNPAARVLEGLIDRTGVTSLAPGTLDKKISGKLKATREESEVELTPKEYEQFQKDVGQEFSQKVLTINADPELTDAQKASRIEKAYDTIKKKYTNRIRREKGMYIKK